MQIFDVFGTMRMEGVENVGNTMQGIGNKLNNIGSSIMGFGAKLTAGVSVPLAGLAVQGVKYNSTVQDLQTSFKVLLGSEDDAIKLTNKLKKVGAETPFEITGLASATKTLLAFGVEQDKLIPTMTRIGDVSLGNNEAFQSMSRVMGQINALGKLQGGDLNQLINWGWNPLNEITKRTGETMEEVRDRMSKGKVSYKEVEQALKDATSEGGRFYKGMAEGSKTLSGKISTMMDVFNDFLGQATKPLFDFLLDKAVPTLTGLMEKFNTLSQPVKTAIMVFGALGIVVPPLIVGLGILVTVAGSVITAIGTVVSFIGSVGLAVPAAIVGILALVGAIGGLLLTSDTVRGGLMNIFNDIKNKIGEVVSWVKLHIEDLKIVFMGLPNAIFSGDFSKIYPALKNMIPEETFQKVDDIVRAFQRFRERVIEVRDKLIEFGQFLGEIFAPVFSMLGETITSLDFTPVFEGLNNLWNSIQPLIPVFEALAVAAGVVLATAIGIVIGALNGIISILPNVYGMIYNLYSVVVSVFSLIVGIITGDSKMIKQSLVNLWESVKGVFVNAFFIIVNFVKGFVNGIVTWFTNLYDTLVGHSIIPDMINSIVKWFTSLPGKVLGKIQDLVTKGIKFFTDFKDGVLEKFEGLAKGISGVVDGIKNTIGGIKDAVSGALGKLGDLASKAKNISIPGFATGVRNFGGGWAIVGENGAELLELPRGTNVYNNQESKRMLSAGRGYTPSSNISNTSNTNNYINMTVDFSKIKSIDDILNLIEILKTNG